MKKQQTNNFPAWDLSDMYQDINDIKISQDLEKVRKGNVSFAKNTKEK